MEGEKERKENGREKEKDKEGEERMTVIGKKIYVEEERGQRESDKYRKSGMER